MIVEGAFTVFVIGMRHGADPDHLAAIDNLTRNTYGRRPRLSRFVGTLFAGGHSAMVLAVSALVGLLGARVAMHGTVIERIGTAISIVMLLVIAALNISALRSGGGGRARGLRMRLLPAALRTSGNPLVAIPVGVLFGFGFETSSQVATYAIAFGAGAGFAGALLVGAMFCAGMLVTDTLDSVLVHRVVAFGGDGRRDVIRTWAWTVTLLAVAVALDELAGLCGLALPFTDLTVSLALCAVLAVVFAFVFVRTRAMPQRATSLPTALPQGD